MVKNFWSGLVVGFCLFGCAGMVSYRHYGIELDSWSGKLLGPTPASDLSIDRCKPTASNKLPCVVLFTETFDQMNNEIIELKEKLISCEQGH